MRQAIGAKWQIIFSLLIADSSHILFMCYLLTVKITCSHLRVCPVSLSVLPRSLIPLGKGAILLCSPHSPAITNELVSGFLKVSLFTFLSHQPFINWLSHLFPPNCLTNREGRKCWLSELIPSATSLQPSTLSGSRLPFHFLFF